MKPFIYGLKFFACAILATCVILNASHSFMHWSSDEPIAVSTAPTSAVIVIDAGHGGEDAGAVAQDGTLEKDLNLKIAKCLEALCEINGNTAIMTRDDDRLLYDRYGELDDYTGQKKIYDLKNRVRIANEQENPIFVSIHMNKFSSSKYSGTQIYYSPNDPSSEMLARALQNSTRTYLQPTNNRQIKRADSSIYVLNSLPCPAVLVECGFLSNECELGLLKTERYQTSLALVIFSGILSMS